MPAERASREGPLIRLWQWVKDQLVQDVPRDIALCEFDCRKLQCTMGEWETCARRLEKAAEEEQSRAPKRAPGALTPPPKK